MASTMGGQRTPANSSAHSSRRDHNSISSTASASTSRSERGSRANQPAVDTTVTRLLVSIKALLESLTLWSSRQIDEETVSDAYVRLGNDFNNVVAAFAVYQIDTSELASVPDDLRVILEQCLAEEASKESLEIYLPSVRRTITQLLQGLKLKQTAYRQISLAQGRERGETSEHRERGSRVSTRSRAGPSEGSEAGSMSSRRNGRRKDGSTASTSTVTNGDHSDFVGGFSPRLLEQQTTGNSLLSSPGPPLSYDSDRGTPKVPISTPFSRPAVIPERVETPPPPSTSPPPVPASIKRYSLVDKPAADRPILIETPPEEPARALSPTLDTPAEASPAVARSLAALKSNDLERRASKRFSTYNFSKLSGGATRERSVRGSSHPNRRSLVAGTSNLTPGELAMLAEEGDEEEEAPTSTLMEQAVAGAGKIKLDVSTIPEPRKASPAPYTPTIVTTTRTPEPPQPTVATIVPAARVAPAPSPTPETPTKITVFLQLGREVKKATIEPEMTFGMLRMLFVDRFSYNPGLENFPAIYIRDPSSGVQYELEDTTEVKEKCLLSLNIEPLDQIKQHIDTQISALAMDIKDLKQTVSSSSRPTFVPDVAVQPFEEATPAKRPSDRQLQTVARRLSRVFHDAPPSFAQHFQSIPEQMTGQSTLQPQLTGGSVLSDYTGRIMTDLKTQFDEVQHLRRDLGVMRQIYKDFMQSTKGSLAALRTQTQSVKQIATTSVGGARGYIDSGKQKLDSRTQTTLTEIEKLQDTIEAMKDDVIKRHVTPNQLVLKGIKKDLESMSSELSSLGEHVNTVKPMWKKTWEEELQTIVEEQQFLLYQEQFINDLREDHKAMMEVLGHVEKVITLRKPHNGKRGRSFKPTPAPEDKSGEVVNNVMLEIRSAAVDPEKRLKAIEANQRNREKDLATRSDEFHSEIVDFVSQKKLKMTGGAEEVERNRQRKNDITLKAMFTGDSALSVSSFATESVGTASPGFETPPVSP